VLDGMSEPMMLSNLEAKTIHNASRNLRYWRYAKWIDLGLGIFLTAFPFWLNHNANGAAVWQGIPLYIFAALGAMLLVQFFFPWRRREQELLLKLYAAQEKL
jgi:hypothetical protein